MKKVTNKKVNNNDNHHKLMSESCSSQDESEELPKLDARDATASENHKGNRKNSPPKRIGLNMEGWGFV